MDGKVLPINDVYVALCMWMLTIRRTRQIACIPPDCLADNTYVGDIFDKILLGKGNITYTVQGNDDELHMDRIQRGLDVQVTRMHI